MSQDNKPDRKAFKDWFDEDAAIALGKQVGSAWESFDQHAFVSLVTPELHPLEFHDRIALFSRSLRATLPDSVPGALEILTQSLPGKLPDCEAVTEGWLQWPLGKFIADYGLDYFDESFAAMIELTKRFSSEFAVRPFVERYPDKTISALRELTADPDTHVRRWCSEGTRPLLPWGKKLHALVADPTSALPILESLKDDPERYVTRSVANHLNDISKNSPELVIDVCRQWSCEADSNREWLVRHALRSLIKDGNSHALEILGFAPPETLKAQLFVEPHCLTIGEKLSISAKITNEGNQPCQLMIDYLVHYMKKNGTTSPKVFKWRKHSIAPGETIQIAKTHSLKPVTTRVLYPGRHRIQLQINGQIFGDETFELA